MRELVQNWQDQVRKQLSSMGIDAVMMTTHFADDQSSQLAMIGGKLNDGTACCGGLALEWSDDVSTYVQLTNFSTQIPPGALVMGSSNKRGDEGTIGMYGEGMKVEINRLVAQGTDVVIATGMGVWTFGHAAELGGVEELRMSPYPFVPPTHCGHTTVLLRSAISRPLRINRHSFLFLQPPGQQPVSLAPVQPGPICMLYGEAACGAMYVSGVLIKKYDAGDPDGLAGFGLNYTGPKSLYPQLGLGRDRNRINVKVLVTLLPGLVSRLHGEAALKTQALTIIYDELCHFPNGAIRGLVEIAPPVGQEDLHTALCQDLLAHFNAKHASGGAKLPFPIHGHKGMAAMQAESNEATMLGAQPVEVSEPLFKMLWETGACPTLDSLWEQASQHVLALPAWIPEPEGSLDGKYMRRLAEAVCRKAENEFSVKIQLKQFPPRQSTACPVIGASTGSGIQYAVDMCLLHREKVHEWLLSEQMERPCGIASGSDRCNGLCSIERFENAMTMAIQKATGMSARQLQRMLNWHRWQRENKELVEMCITVDQPCHGSEPPEPQQFEEDPYAVAACGMHPGHGAADIHPEVEHGAVRSSQTQLQRTDSIDDAIQQAVKQNITMSSLNATDRPAMFTSDPTEASNMSCVDDAMSAINVQLRPECPGTIPVYTPAGLSLGTKCGSTTIQGIIAELQDIIQRLDAEVFRCNFGDSSILCVFWEECNTAALWRPGSGIFFNAFHYYQMNHNSKNTPALEVLSYWFVTFCHELAHIMTKRTQHDLQHLREEESIVRRRLIRFHTLLQQLQ